MKSRDFIESQIFTALKENEEGKSVAKISQELGIDRSTFYYWRKKYAQKYRHSMAKIQ
ncbi:transposase, partial [Myroides marinus]|uniref:transposase n=1 Tax=Myroides marinus TaxID=703342 RepID=UPI000579582D